MPDETPRAEPRVLGLTSRKPRTQSTDDLPEEGRARCPICGQGVLLSADGLFLARHKRHVEGRWHKVHCPGGARRPADPPPPQIALRPTDPPPDAA